MTIYCATASCGMRNEYTGGVKPNFCQYCGQPFSKAFVPKVTESSRPTRGESHSSYEFNEKLEFDKDSIKVTANPKLTLSTLKESAGAIERPTLEPELNEAKAAALKNMMPVNPPPVAKPTRKRRGSS